MVKITINIKDILRLLFIDMLKNSPSLNMIKKMEVLIELPDIEINVARSFIERTCKNMLKESISLQIKEFINQNNNILNSDNWETKTLKRLIEDEAFLRADFELQKDKKERKQKFLSEKFKINFL